MQLPKSAEKWFLPYLKDRLRRKMRGVRPERVWVAITDHYEPLGRQASVPAALARVGAWRDNWPRIAELAPRDAAGERPQYTFFYPQEEYHREILDRIAEIVRLGVADVEVHIHHDKDTPASFSAKVTEFCRRLTENHGLLRQREGRTVFGFIHGNWALDDSRPDGRWCGVRGEIALLRDLGCYGDFTMPSVPSATQGRVVNEVYWCTSRTDNQPRSFDRGVRATVGGGIRGDLLMFTGPLGVRFENRLRPRLETGEIAGYDLPTRSRIKQWFRLAPAIGNDLFLKLYTHGGHDRNLDPLLKDGLANLYRWIAEEAEQQGIQVRWATAWQMYQAASGLICRKETVESGAVRVAGEYR